MPFPGLTKNVQTLSTKQVAPRCASHAIGSCLRSDKLPIPFTPRLKAAFAWFHSRS